MSQSRFPAVATSLVGGMLLTFLGLVVFGPFAVRGFAQTEDVNATWTDASCAEMHNWGGPGPLLPGEFQGMDVGHTVLGTVGVDTIDVGISNGYPSYAVDCALTFAHTGTITAQTTGATITPISGLGACTQASDGMHCPELTVLVSGATTGCLAPGQEQTIHLLIHVEQAAHQQSGMAYQVQTTLVECETTTNTPQTSEPPLRITTFGSQPSPSAPSVSQAAGSAGATGFISEVEAARLPATGTDGTRLQTRLELLAAGLALIALGVMRLVKSVVPKPVAQPPRRHFG